VDGLEEKRKGKVGVENERTTFPSLYVPSFVVTLDCFICFTSKRSAVVAVTVTATINDNNASLLGPFNAVVVVHFYAPIYVPISLRRHSNHFDDHFRLLTVIAAMPGACDKSLFLDKRFSVIELVMNHSLLQ